MGVDVLVETVIQRPVSEVASYSGDPTNAPAWYVNIDSVEWQTPEPVAPGSRMALRNTGEPSGFSRLAAPVMQAAMRRAMTKDLAALKRLLEGAGPTPR